jgi:hypothetical protein
VGETESAENVAARAHELVRAFLAGLPVAAPQLVNV